MKHIAIIPARSGSKGLKDKNIKELCGKPLIAYSIEAAMESGMFDEIMVSTDSEIYAKIAREYGANVPFLRSEILSNDNASSWDVVKDVLERYRELGKKYDTVALLQPTSPLRDAYDIQCAYEVLHEKKATSVVSVCQMEHSPMWCNVLPVDDSLCNFILPETMSKGGRQHLEQYYRLNGAIYICGIDNQKKTLATLYDESCFAYKMSKNHSVDIDDISDFMMAEFYLSQARS